MSTALYEKTKHAIRESIRRGDFAIGDVLPPVEKLARKLPGSNATVRKALVELAREGVVQRIKRKGTIVARQPCLGRVALMLGPDAHLNGLLAEPIYARLHDIGYDVEVVPFAYDARLVEQHCQRLHRQQPARLEFAVVIDPMHPFDPARASIRDAVEAHWRTIQTFPRRVAFALSNEIFDPLTHCVGVDYQLASRLVVEHLLKLGHRRIAVTDTFEGGYTTQSAEACKHLMEIAGGKCWPMPLWNVDPQNARGEHLIASERITAIWTLNDSDAVVAHGRLQRAGVRVPEEVSIIGRNDTPWCVQGPLPLTSLSINPAGVADAIAQVIERTRLADGCVPGTTLVPPNLVPRGSTAPARQS